MTTSISKTPYGELIQFVQHLGTAGLTYEDVQRVNKRPSLATSMVTPLRSVPEWQPPTWWRTPEQQLAKAHELWPNAWAWLPEVPTNFVPQTKTEVLLLHMPDEFDSLWNKVVAPSGYTKYRTEAVKSGKRNLRLAPNKREYKEPVWLAFDPEHGKGVRPDSLWGQSDLVASEVFSALIQFPDWCLSWFNGASAPNLSGYQLKYDGGWSSVPYLSRWDDNRRLNLRACWAGNGSVAWASPSVREC